MYYRYFETETDQGGEGAGQDLFVFPGWMGDALALCFALGAGRVVWFER